MSEPRYTRAEQAERMREFERWVLEARAAWRRGEAVILMSMSDYLRLSGVPFYDNQPARTKRRIGKHRR